MTHDQIIEFLYRLPEDVEAITIKGTSFSKIGQLWTGLSYVSFPRPIEWNDRSDKSSVFSTGERVDREHDVTGELYDQMYFLQEVFPEHANKWADGKFGGNVFSIGERLFKTTDAVRGIGYIAVIAFDKHGHGAVFIKE